MHLKFKEMRGLSPPSIGGNSLISVLSQKYASFIAALFEIDYFFASCPSLFLDFHEHDTAN